METATIEQLHRLHSIPLKAVERLPAIRRFTHQAGLSKSCAVKEFRFPPPLAKRKEKKKKKLPPIPEHMLPRRHNSLEEHDAIDDMLPLPGISAEPTTSIEQDDRSFSAEVLAKTPTIMFNVREFTFPESSAKSAKRKKSSQAAAAASEHIQPAFTPRFKDTTIQARIEKLAKQKRKEKARRTLDRRYERKLQSMQDFSVPAKPKMNAFKAKRDREINTIFHLRDNKQLPFKQMTRPPEEVDKPKINPRLYTKIVDNIYSYSRGILGEHDESSTVKSRSERLMVSPATGREVVKNTQSHKPSSFLPPIHL